MTIVGGPQRSQAHDQTRKVHSLVREVTLQLGCKASLDARDFCGNLLKGVTLTRQSTSY